MDHEIRTNQPPATRSGGHPLPADRGASLVEYALLMALIAVVCILALTALGEAASDSYNDSANRVEQA